MGEAETLPNEPAPDVAEIRKAYDYGAYYGLVIVAFGSTEEEPYVLYPDDPYGLAPGLRAQLERMVAEGEIVIEPPPPVAQPQSQ
ncbi:hypothetical protein EHS39_13245 [Ensifer sp. MPMI2T]|nr:hypothetical protein EHS39_13245 [Ensifer sp. MPMI2T]